MNKKLIIWIFAVILLSSLAFADDYTLQDSYTSGAAGDGITYSGTVNALSTSFNVTVSDYLMTKLSVQFANWSLSQPSNVSIRVYNLTNGTALPNAYSYEVISDGNITFSGAGGTYSYYNFTFIKNGGIQLEKAKFYGISIVIQPNRTNGELRVYEGSSTGYDEFYTTAGIPKTDSGWQDWAGHTGKRFNFRAFNCSTCIAGASYQKYINFSGTYAPLNGYLSNSNTINFNATFNISSIINSANCSLYINGTLNESINISSGTDVLPNFTKTLSDGNYSSVYINCYLLNSTNSINSTNSSVFIDTINPTITTNFQNFSYFINKNITGSFNTSDNDGIHTFNLSINGVSIFNRTGINNQTYNYTLNIPQSSPVVEGINTLSLYVADGHTANELISANSYDYNKGLVFHDSLEFIFKEPYISGRIKIYQKDGSLFDVWDTKAEIDKYSFTFEPFKKTDRYTFIVEADSTLFISNIPSSKFKKWIIFNEHWLDLYPYNIIDIRRIKDNIVEIDVNNIDEKTEKLEFNSIGDLNIVYYNASFLSGSASVLYTSPEVETVDTSIKLNITAYNSSYFNSDNITAWLYYNGTNYTTTKTVVDNTILFSKTVNTGKNTNTFENRTFNWVYVINTTYVNTSFTNQSIIKMIVSNCSEAPANTYFALNFSTKDLNNNEVYTTQSAIFYYWKGTDVLTNSMYYSSSVTSAYCIYPNETIYANYQIVFNNASYAQVNYFQNAKALDYITEYKTIYLTTLTGSTSISTYVVDEYDNALQGYIVEAYFYEIATNSYQLLSSEKTDLEGKAKFNLDVSIYQYKFLVYNTNGTQVYTSATGKLFDTSYTFRVNLGSSTSNIYAQLYNLDYTLTASLSKKTCNLSWNDFSDLISKIELQVDKLNVSSNENQTLGIVSSALANSILGYDLVSYNNATWLCSVYVTANSDGKRYFLKSVSLDLREEWQIFGDSEALFMSFIFVGTMAFMGLFIGAEASLILMLLGIITFQLLGFLKLGWGIGITGLIILVGILVLIVKRR